MIELDSLLSEILPVAQSQSREVESVLIEQAFHRVLAQDIHASLNVPAHDNSAMDGYAVRCADFASASSFEVSQRIPAGSSPEPLQEGTVARIFTGAPVPAGADAILMQETAQTDNSGRVSFDELPKPGQWIRYKGEDISQGQLLMSQGTLLDPFKVSLLASIGVGQVPVFKPLKVGVFVTGSELQLPGKPLAPGQIYNSNEYVWRGLLEQLHVEVQSLGIVPDNFEATCEALATLSHCDVVISSGGVSVGEEDHVKPAVEKMGTLRSWKVAMKPGKPIAFGELNRSDGKPCWFFGLPGNPVSSSVAFLLIVQPFLGLLKGQTLNAVDWRNRISKKISGFDWLRPDQRREEFLRVRLEGESLKLFPNQSSGVLTSMDQSTGLVRLPVGQVVKQGDLLDYVSFQDLKA